MRTIDVLEARTHLSRLVDRAHAGEEIILAKAGRPWARLVPLAVAPVKRQPGRLKGRVGGEFFEPLPSRERAAWE
jgi:prevent-host-death family protein